MSLFAQLRPSSLPPQTPLRFLLKDMENLSFLSTATFHPEYVFDPCKLSSNQTQQVRKAIDELLIALSALSELSDSEIRTIYQTIYSLFPYFEDQDLFKLLQTTETVFMSQTDGILQQLLNCSIQFKNEQKSLALLLAFWYQKKAINQSFTQRLSLYQESMCYLAKAIKISQSLGHVEELKNCHRWASQLIFILLKTYRIDEHQLQDRLDQAARGCERLNEQGTSTAFHELFSQIKDMNRFCIRLEDLQQIGEAYAVVGKVVVHLPPIVKEKYTGPTIKKTPDSFGEKPIDYTLEALKLRDKDFRLPSTYVTEDYVQKLHHYRAQFSTFSDRKNPSIEDVRSFQKDICSALKHLFEIFLNDAFMILGPPPCKYSIQCMGSVGREEPCPYSDLDFFMIVDKQGHEEYFRNLVKVLSILLMSLGETARLPLNFTCVEKINPSGLHIDTGANPEEPSLLGTPEILAANQNQEAEPGTPAQTLRQSTTLATNDPELFKIYNDHSKALLKPKLKLSSAGLLRPTTLALKASEVSMPKLNLQDSDLSFAQKFRTYFQPNLLALGLFKARMRDYHITWKSPSFEVINLKKNYVELLHHLLSDLAIYYGLSETNTLDIIDQLALRELVESNSILLLKQAVAFLYTLRVNVHLAYQEQKEEVFRQSRDLSDVILKSHELSQLERYYWIVLRPFYKTLSSVFEKNSQELFLVDKLDLLNCALEDALALKDERESRQIILHLASYLIETNASEAEIQGFFEKLSQNLTHESLRQFFFNTIVEKAVRRTALIAHLSMIPNPAGFRYRFNQNASKLLESFLDLATHEPSKVLTKADSTSVNSTVMVSSPSLPPVFLKSDVINSLLDQNGDIKNSYENSAHRVSAVKNLHFKQKPTHPLMEYAIHNLMFRLAGDLTPSTLLVRFEVNIKGKKKVYPVLISQTIPGQTLKEVVNRDVNLRGAAWARWTWMVLATILTRPGDGRFSNYIVDDSNHIYCIDNDISFVEPILVEGLSRKVYFSSALFCLLATSPLDKKVLKNFYSLNVDFILQRWIDDVIQKEQEYLSIFSEQEREQLYNEDPNNRFKATILFREGALATLNLQFTYLQNQISSLLIKNTDVTALDLLKMLIHIREKPTADNSVGEHIHRVYKKASLLPIPEDRLKQVTSRPHDRSLTSVQSDRVSIGKIPTYAEVEKLQYWAPSRAKEELLATMVFRLNQSLPFLTRGVIHGKKTLRVSFKEITHQGKPDEERQRLIIQGLIILASLEKDKLNSISFHDCAVLDSTFLDAFLHLGIQYIDLFQCPLIKDRDIESIQVKCPAIQNLRLEGCFSLKNLARGLFTKTPLSFTQLEVLEIKDCPQLSMIYIDVPLLKTLAVRKTPQLKSLTTNPQNLQSLELSHCPILPHQEIIKLFAPDTLVEMRLSDCGLLKSVEIPTTENKARATSGTLSSPSFSVLHFQKLENIEIQNCHSLIKIDCQAPLLTHLILRDNSALIYLVIYQLQFFPKLGIDSCSKLDISKFLNEIFQWLIPTNQPIFPNLLETWVVEILADFISLEIDTAGFEATNQNYINPLFRLIEMSKKDPEYAITAANAITILNFADISLAGKDFRGARIPGANLGMACLERSDLRYTDLERAFLVEAALDYCKLAEANMHEIKMKSKVIKRNDTVTSIIANIKEDDLIIAEEKNIYVINIDFEQVVNKLEGHRDTITTLLLLEGGKKLASASKDKMIIVWHIATGKELKKLVGHSDTILSLAELEKYKKLASGSEDTTIRVWDIEMEKELKKLEGHTDFVTALVPLEGGKKLASSSLDKTIRVWDIEMEKELKKLKGHTGFVTALVPLEEGKKLVSGSSDYTIRIWDVETGEELKKLQRHTNGVTHLSLLDEGKKLASASEDGSIRVWDVWTGKELNFLAEQGWTKNLIPLARGKKLASVSYDNTIRVWDIMTREGVKTIKRHTNFVTALVVQEGGIKLASASWDNTIRVWNVETGRELKKIVENDTLFLTLVMLERGKKLVSGGSGNRIGVWDIETGKELKRFEGHTDRITGLAVLEDGKKLVSGSDDKTIRLWDLDSGKELKRFEGHTDRITGLALLEGGKKLVSGSGDKTIRLWDLDSGKELKRFQGHTKGITGLALLEGGKKLVSGAWDDTIRFWDLRTGEELFALSTISGITTMASKDFDLLYAGDELGGIWCWKLNFENLDQPFTLLWTHRPILSCKGVELSGIKNLSETNRRIMEAHGAVDRNSNP